MSERNLDLWDEYGRHLIPVMPFMDNVVARSEGSFLVDVEGNRMLDLASGQFCTVLGHNHPGFVERIASELRNNLHVGSQYVTASVLQAAKRVSEITPPGLDRVIFLSTGTEANEFAMRVAKVCTNRNGMVGFDRGYYGVSLATRSLSAISQGHIDATPRTGETHHLLAPDAGRCPARCEGARCDGGCLDISIRMLGDAAQQVAAIVVEPVLSAGGMIYPTADYFAQVKRFAHDIGALLIVDEAQTGFGRCGRWFDCENLDLAPDILVFSKTSGNGFPSSGVAISDEISGRLVDSGFSHLSSHQNDPLAAAAVCAVIDTIRSERLLERCVDSGRYFLDALRALALRRRHVGRVRGRGLMLAFDLVEHDGRDEPCADMAMPFALACKARGVHLTYTYYDRAIRIIPPLTISRAEIDLAVGVFDSVLDDIEHGRNKRAEYEQ
jgi:2,2-dialkylglycine decarboxylase (pyruvate)